MSMGFIKDGKYVQVAGNPPPSGELVMGASTIRKGTFVINWADDKCYISQTVTFDSPMPDADYEVDFAYTDSFYWAELMPIRVSKKTKNGFTVLCSTMPASDGSTNYYTAAITYTAFKLYTVEGVAELEAKVAENASDITTLKSSVNNVARYELPNSVYNSDVVTPGSTGASITIQSYGKIRIIEGGGVPFKTVGNKENVAVLTLPSGYRPKYKAELMAMCTSGTAGAGVLRCWVETSGIVRVWTGDMQCGGYLFISGTYIAAD